MVCVVFAAEELQSLKSHWQNTPQIWDQIDDPCGAPWVGVTCTNSRITSLSVLNPSSCKNFIHFRKLPSMSLAGNLRDRIGGLTELRSFHFNRNQLSGFIPPVLFSSDMMLIHVRLNRNALSGEVPKNRNNLTNLKELNLANNELAGPLPDLTKMDSLSYLFKDLSNNSFYSSESSEWFSTLPSLTTLVIENGSLQGTLTPKVFSFPNIQQVLLRNNAFNGTFDLDDSFSPQLQLVDLRNNQISAVTLSADYKNKLILVGNPVCTGLPNVSFCQP
ncbi:hypothetical protein NC652_021372 [Populus alba x Populus x berolinensis]|nr:hypothetical protein NC652_021372 [Populus alba x Populus x berolinensis]